MSAILNAYTAELQRLSRAIAAVAHPFGLSEEDAEKYLSPAKNALLGFMAATQDPSGFTPPPNGPPDVALQNAYVKFAPAKPSKTGTVMPVAWLARMFEIAMNNRIGESPSILTLVPELLVSSLDQYLVSHGLAPLPYIAAEATMELVESIQSCTQEVLRRRLLDAPINPDFPDIAARTASAIVYAGIATRLCRHPFLNEILGFEYLLTAGILPIGRKKEGDQYTPYGVRMYKLPEEREVLKRETVAYQLPVRAPEPPPAKSTEGTLIGIGHRGPLLVEPRLAFMSKLNQLAQGRPVDANMMNHALRTWSGFMKHHVESKSFAFAVVPDVEILSIVQGATGYETHVVRRLTTEELYMQGKSLDELAHHRAYGEREDKHIDPRKRMTVRSPFGHGVWYDPYRDDESLRDTNDPAYQALRAMRQELRKELTEHLVSGLQQSLKNAHIHSETVQQALIEAIRQTFFLLFDAALCNDVSTFARAGRLADLYFRGAVPIGTHLIEHEKRVCSVVM